VDEEEHFLGYYTEKGIKYSFKKYGIFREIKKLGFEKIELKLIPTELNRGKLFIYSLEPKLDVPLLELELNRFYFSKVELEKVNRPDLLGKCFLYIEWMALQNPLKSGKKLFPGQRYPGLGLGRFAFELLLVIKWRLKMHGLINKPHFFHNAVMYASEFDFFDLEREKHFERIKREFSHLSLHEISWAIEEGRLYFNDGTKVVWEASYQIRMHK
jgi:hypothetical protein